MRARCYDEWIEQYRQPVLIYNPYAGKLRRNPRILQRTTAVLARANVNPRLVATDSAGHATELARDAVERALGAASVRWVPPPVNGKYNGFRITLPPPGAGLATAAYEDEDEGVAGNRTGRAK